MDLTTMLLPIMAAMLTPMARRPPRDTTAMAAGLLKMAAAVPAVAAREPPK